MRSGTLPTHQIVGMGEAFAIAKQEMAAENVRIKALSDRFFKQVSDLEELYVNGSKTARVPHNLNLSFNYVEGESLLMSLKDIAVSSGSACTSASLERPTYCALWAATTSWRTARSASPSAVSPPKKKSTMPRRKSARPSTNCVSCRRCGTCTKTALTSPRSSGPPTKQSPARAAP